jgi:hypothetical protein
VRGVTAWRQPVVGLFEVRRVLQKNAAMPMKE